MCITIISIKNILPIVHHDATTLVKSGAGIIGERDVTRLCNLSVTLGNVQQKSCTLGRIASLNVTKKTHESYIIRLCGVVPSSTDGRFPGQSAFSSKRINQQLQCRIHVTALGSLLACNLKFNFRALISLHRPARLNRESNLLFC